MSITAMSLWKKLPKIPKDQEQKLTRPRGISTSRVVMVCPTPNEEDYSNNLPFSSRYAAVFTDVVREAKINPSKFFVIPCCRYGAKALSKNTLDIRDFVLEAIRREIFNFIITVGDDATKWIVNGGKKVNMGYFYNKLVYPPNLFHKPLFVFPDPKGLIPVPTDDEREAWWRQRSAEMLAERIEKYARTLARALNMKNYHG